MEDLPTYERKEYGSKLHEKKSVGEAEFDEVFRFNE